MDLKIHISKILSLYNDREGTCLLMLYRDIFGWEGGGDKGEISQVLTKKVKDLRFSRSEGFIYAYVHQVCT